MTRARLSATVDPELLAAGRLAVAAGRAESLSSWVNGALARQVEHDRRMQAMDALVREFEAENGPITDDDVAAAERWIEATAVKVRRKAPAAKRRSTRRGAA